MSDGFKVYVFVLCFIVFTLLTAAFSYLITYIVRQDIKIIKSGIEDGKLTTEYKQFKTKEKKAKALSVIDKVFSVVLAITVMAAFIFSLCVNVNGNKVVGKMPTLQVVQSASMSEKHNKNTYLIENNLNDQIKTFDVILTYALPAEEELKLYDIVVYEVDNVLLIHRIVGIEEPNEKHPDERYFLLQGDNVENPDRFPVRYNQMKGIYRGQRIPFVGSLISFLQSPAGYLIMALVLFTIAIMPFIEKKLFNEKIARLTLIGIIKEEEPKDVVAEEISISTTMPLLDIEERLQTDEVIDIEDEQRKEYLTFEQKLEIANQEVRERYFRILTHLYKIKDIRKIESKKYHSFKKGLVPIVRLAIRGKTLNAYIGLNPKEYQETKYIYTDVSAIKNYELYPMRVKISSKRQTRWAIELIDKIVEKNQLDTYAISKLIKIKGTEKSFKQRLNEAKPEIKQWYDSIVDHLTKSGNIKVRDCKEHQTFKKGAKPVAKIKIVGKTLNVYLGTNSKQYKDSKYRFSDASIVKAHQSYPMRFKITSNRKVKHVKELIDIIVK